MAFFTAIGTAIAGALFAGSALAATLIAGGLAFAAQLAISYLTRPKARAYSAVQGETQFGGDVPVGSVYGLSKVRGQRVGYFKWGSGNKFNAEVFALANGWCDGLEPEVYFYGAKHTLVARPIIGNEAAHYGVLGFSSLISIRFYDGRPGQGVDTKLVADTVSLGRRWKATSVGTGLTYLVIERKYDSDKFSKGKPEFDFVLRGLREYDPRKDSTIVGGSGAHRINNPATWQFAKNPALHRFNYQLGLRGRVSGRTLIGEGKSIGQLDLGTYIAAMNVCDTPKGGKATYECALYVTSNDDHTEILKEFDDAMAGYGLNRRGLSGVVPGAPQIPVLELTADDIPVDRAQDVQNRKSAFDLYNHLSGQYTSKEALWQPESLKPVYANADVSRDGRPRQTANDFLQVTDPDIAQYLLTIRYRQNRKGGSATVPVSRRVGLAVQEGEWITFDGITWLITEWQCDDKFRFTLKLAETGADVYASGGIEPGPIVIPPTDPINPSLLSTVAGFKVEVGMVQGAAGYEVPVLRFTWTPPDDPTITAVRFEYGVEGGTKIFEDQSTDPEKGEYITGKNVVSGQVYRGRATITTVPDRFKTWTPFDSTISATGMLSVAVDLGAIASEIAVTLQQLYVYMGEVRGTLEQIAAASAEGIGATISQEAVAVRYRNATAVAMSQLSASITEIDGQLTAQAEALTAVAASVDDASAEGLFRLHAEAGGGGGVVSRAVAQVRATLADDWVAAGYVIEAGFTGGVPFSRFTINASQLVVSDGINGGVPFAIEGGVVKLKVGRIGNAIIDQLITSNGKLTINGAGTSSDISIRV